MKKFKLIFLFFSMLFAESVIADELTVADGTGSSKAPFYTTSTNIPNCYANSQFIIPARLLTNMQGTTIKKIKFYTSTSATTTLGSISFNIYIKELENNDSIFSSSTFRSWEGLTYSGGISISGGEMEITLDTPFSYQNKNLLIECQQTSEGTYTFIKWNGLEFKPYNNYKVLAQNGASNIYQYNVLPKTTFTYSVVLNETLSNSPNEGEHSIDLTYTKAADKWGTIALPFATTTTELGGKYGATITAYGLKSFDGSNTITCEEVTDLEAGKPYIIYSEDALSGTVEFTGKTITTTTPGSVTCGNVTFHATYSPMAAGSMNGNWGITPDGNLAEGDESATMGAMRGYFTCAGGARLNIVFDDATGISTLNTERGTMNNVYYNMNGQRVAKPTKGLYIVNGKKTLVK